MRERGPLNTGVSVPTKRRVKIGVWMYVLVFVLVVIALIYVLAANAAAGNALSQGRTPLGEAALAFVQSTLRISAANPIFPLLALASAFLLGGLHAMTPGHNKTLTGVYLVGSRARLRHAVLIGMATAFSHTASALVIGTLALSTAGQIASAQYLRWVGLPSGILTVCLGGWLLRRYLRGGSAHPHSHDHDHDHSQDHIHDHDHPHDHHKHSHDHTAPDRMTLGGLVAMGLMHGIVPTFDALAIILIALTVNQFLLGVGLIIAYSLGIAGVLVAVGALFVRTQKVLSDNPRFDRVARRAPAFAAIVVILLGLSLVVRTLIA